MNRKYIFTSVLTQQKYRFQPGARGGVFLLRQRRRTLRQVEEKGGATQVKQVVLYLIKFN
jgi:hypothetical protein